MPAPGRGGRRPGAGGKPGNLNALKHGRRSAQFAHLGLILATIPETRQALLHLATRHRLQQRKAEQAAVLLKPLRLLWPPALIGALRIAFRQVRDGRRLANDWARGAVERLV